MNRSIDPKEKLELILKDLNENTKFLENKNFIQHGTTTVYDHVISVSLRSIEIAEKYDLDVDYDSLIRGALLHDYFLYDWHDKDNRPHLHGIFHPRLALINAKKELLLNEIEEDIIKKHMFPLTPIPPKYIESWIVVMADKTVATRESVGFMFKNKANVGANIWNPLNYF